MTSGRLAWEGLSLPAQPGRVPGRLLHQLAGRESGWPAPPALHGGYWSTLPIKAIVLQLRKLGIPAEISPTAGTFVCNHVFYGLRHGLALYHPGGRVGFIHVPCRLSRARAASPPALRADDRGRPARDRDLRLPSPGSPGRRTDNPRRPHRPKLPVGPTGPDHR